MDCYVTPKLEKTASWKKYVTSLLNFGVLVFLVQAFKEITQILFQICSTPWKKYWNSII